MFSTNCLDMVKTSSLLYVFALVVDILMSHVQFKISRVATFTTITTDRLIFFLFNFNVIFAVLFLFLFLFYALLNHCELLYAWISPPLGLIPLIPNIQYEIAVKEWNKSVIPILYYSENLEEVPVRIHI